MDNDPPYDDLVAEFALAAADPEKWLKAARELHAAAALLEPFVSDQSQKHVANMLDNMNYSLGEDLRSSYLMLVGFAAENLLKAAIVKADPDRIRKEAATRKRLPKILHTHDLYELAKRAGLQPSHRMETRLRRFAHIATWSGRYPLPVLPADYRGDATFSNGDVRIISYVTSDDPIDARAVLRWIEIETGCSCRPAAN